MRKLIVLLGSLAVVAGTLTLALALSTAGLAGCPQALLQGTLVEHEGTLAVAAPDGTVTPVEWPFGYGVGEEDGTLTLTRPFTTVAREGDLVSMGGGAGGAGFRGCGPVTPGLLSPADGTPRPAGAALAVTGTAFEPCIPPPSACGARSEGLALLGVRVLAVAPCRHRPRRQPALAAGDRPR